MYRFYARLFALAAAMLLVLPTPGIAKSAPPAAWTVSQRSGDVRILRSGVQPVAVMANAQLSPGDVISTGANGRVMLTRGGDYIVVAPGSRLLLPSAEQPSGFTRLIQQVGTMFYKVKHTGIPHFAVDAPMLAAVVKGTSFTVIVDENRSAVQVTDGVVEVTAAEGGMRSLVEHGDTVFINRLAPKALLKATPTTIGLTTGTRRTNDTVTIAGTPEQTLNAVAAQTGGLVRVDLPAAPVQVAAIVPSVGQPQTVNTTASGAAYASVAVTPAAPDTPGSPNPGAAPATVPATPATTIPAAATTPAVTTPVTTTPATVVPVVTTPVVSVPAVAVPAVTTPTVTLPAVTVPAVSVPAVTVPAITTPAVTLPAVTLPAVTTPVVTTPVITVPVVTVPAVTVPAITIPAITTPVVTVPAITTPAITTPVITVPAVTVPAVTVPAVTVPAVTVPTVTTPAVTVPAVTVPAITTPVITTPVITVPAVTVPAITLPPVMLPRVTLPLFGR